MRCVLGEGLVSALMHTIIYLLSPVQIGPPHAALLQRGLWFRGVIIGRHTQEPWRFVVLRMLLRQHGSIKEWVGCWRLRLFKMQCAKYYLWNVFQQLSPHRSKKQKTQSVSVWGSLIWRAFSGFLYHFTFKQIQSINDTETWSSFQTLKSNLFCKLFDLYSPPYNCSIKAMSQCCIYRLLWDPSTGGESCNR